jgi:hypothetical protein
MTAHSSYISSVSTLPTEQNQNNFLRSTMLRRNSYPLETDSEYRISFSRSRVYCLVAIIILLLICCIALPIIVYAYTRAQCEYSQTTEAPQALGGPAAIYSWKDEPQVLVRNVCLTQFKFLP